MGRAPKCANPSGRRCGFTNKHAAGGIHSGSSGTDPFLRIQREEATIWILEKRQCFISGCGVSRARAMRCSPAIPDGWKGSRGCWTNPEFVAQNREYTTWAGRLGGRRLLVSSHGIGGPSTAICVEELFRCGVRTFIRVGTCGGMQREVIGGDLVVASAAHPAGGHRPGIPAGGIPCGGALAGDCRAGGGRRAGGEARSRRGGALQGLFLWAARSGGFPDRPAAAVPLAGLAAGRLSRLGNGVVGAFSGFGLFGGAGGAAS